MIPSFDQQKPASNTSNRSNILSTHYPYQFRVTQQNSHRQLYWIQRNQELGLHIPRENFITWKKDLSIISLPKELSFLQQKRSLVFFSFEKLFDFETDCFPGGRQPIEGSQCEARIPRSSIWAPLAASRGMRHGTEWNFHDELRLYRRCLLKRRS